MSQSQNYDDEEEFPVLTDVVKKGDAKLIEAARRALKEAGKAIGPKFEFPPPTPAEISRSLTTPDLASYNPRSYTARRDSKIPLSDKQLEPLVDDIIKRHTEQMRIEILSILKNRRY
jgi:hypothetical protein